MFICEEKGHFDSSTTKPLTNGFIFFNFSSQSSNCCAVNSKCQFQRFLFGKNLVVMRRSTRNFNIPSPGQTPGIRTFEDWIAQIPAPYGQNGVQMPYLIVGFVCQMPLLKNNRRRLLSSLTKLVYMFRDLLYDGAVLADLSYYKNTTLILKLLENNWN